MIELIPYAGRKHINVLEEGYAGSEMLPLPPANVAKARTLIGTLTLAGEAQTVTLNAGTALIELHGGLYGAAIKWGTATVTNTNFDVLIEPGVSHRAIPGGVTAYNIDKATATLPVVVIEY